MPKILTKRSKKRPEGWHLVEGPLEEFAEKMRAHTSAAPEGKRKNEVLWPILRLHHQRSRYIFELYYKQKAISRELYEYLLRERFADGQLIAKWRKPGFEKLCCLQCIQKSDR